MSYTDQAIVVPIGVITAAGIAYCTVVYVLDDRVSKTSSSQNPLPVVKQEDSTSSVFGGGKGKKLKTAGSTKTKIAELDSERTLKLNFRFRVGICTAFVFYIIWYILCYYVLFPQDVPVTFCSFGPRIEVLTYTSLRAVILYFFLERLRILAFHFLFEKWRYYMILSIIVLAWIFSLIQVFDMEPQFFDGWCNYNLTEAAFAGYVVFIVLFALAHTFLVYQFVGLLKSNQNPEKNSKIEKTIRETRKGFYIYTISALLADLLYVLVYYAFSFEIFEGPDMDTLHFFIPLADVFFFMDSAVGSYSVLSTYGRFQSILWENKCKSLVGKPDSSKAGASTSAQKKGASIEDDRQSNPAGRTSAAIATVTIKEDHSEVR